MVIEPDGRVDPSVRDVETLDDLVDVTAPAPVEPGDLIATVNEVYRVEVILAPPPGAPVVAVLGRQAELTVQTS